MVGTRKITDYGRQMCEVFIRELAELCPDVLVMSGLAYGVDIQCHRQALQNKMETIGVLAHGLDQIYPTLHRNTAKEMVCQGGLLTEFMSRTTIEKRYFVQRNRIVAGCSDATIVVESAARGGSLITAEIAQSYGKEVFAFPGRMTDAQSDGCNRIIANNTAGLLTCAEDFVNAMGWQNDKARQKQLADGIQQELFPELSDEEQLIVEALRNKDRLQLNIISVSTGIPAGRLSGLLFTMEMKGIVRMIPGGMYRLN
jgi:DNA processing protein